jgi:hypothetical protein
MRFTRDDTALLVMLGGHATVNGGQPVGEAEVLVLDRAGAGAGIGGAVDMVGTLPPGKGGSAQ